MKITSGVCKGGCTCGFVRYKLEQDPLIVHCCHCRFCQRQTGSAFVINALYEASKVKIIKGSVSKNIILTPSGKQQIIYRCPVCEIALWSNYLAMGVNDLIHFVRVGALDNPDLLPPDVHIYTESKQPWVVLPSNALLANQFYDFIKTWSPKNLKTLHDLQVKANASSS